jgi:hypothetical protein
MTNKSLPGTHFFILGLACQPVLYTWSSTGNMAVIVASGAFLSFFTFVTPLLIHSFSKKYVTKLYYNQVSAFCQTVLTSVLS